jgi:hypothetical protein
MVQLAFRASIRYVPNKAHNRHELLFLHRMSASLSTRRASPGHGNGSQGCNLDWDRRSRRYTRRRPERARRRERTRSGWKRAAFSESLAWAAACSTSTTEVSATGTSGPDNNGNVRFANTLIDLALARLYCLAFRETFFKETAVLSAHDSVTAGKIRIMLPRGRALCLPRWSETSAECYKRIYRAQPCA